MSSPSSYWLSPELLHADERGMRFGVGDKRGRRGWGLVFLCLGLIVCIVVPAAVGPENMTWDSPRAASPGAGQALAAAGGLVFMLVGWLVAGVVDDLSLDFTTGKYRRRSGVWPLVRRRDGALADFSHLTLHSEKRDCHDREVTVWVGRLAWKDPAQEPMSLLESVDFSGQDGASHRARMHSQLARLADQLGLEVREAPTDRIEDHRTGRLSHVRQWLYGNADVRVRDRGKAAVVFGLMTIGSLWVRVQADFQIGGAVPLVGYAVWAGAVLYVAGGLLWEIVAPSDAGRTHSKLRAWLLATMTLMAAAICLIGPVVR